MTQIDEFESLFRSADKPVFHIEPVTIKKVMIVMDQAADVHQEYLAKVNSFLAVLTDIEQEVETLVVGGDQYSTVGSLLDLIGNYEPDLLCTYRNLHIPAVEYPYSLGVFIDVLTQATSIPVLLLPRPDLKSTSDHILRNTDRVMAVTDHLAGDSYLVTYAALFTQDQGQLTLAHVEDEQVFRKYINVISKIPALDTATAAETIRDQLLKEPRDYIDSCRIGIEQAGIPISVHSVVTMGHHLSDYRDLLREAEIDLLVMHTKDEDQLAMHGLAYPLTIEFRDIPLLLI